MSTVNNHDKASDHSSECAAGHAEFGGLMADGKINAILIHEVDDVATALVELQSGDVGRFMRRGEVVQIAVTENIPKFHKFAVRDIHKAELVRKYGEIIGEAVQDIGKGCHVHEHNIASPK